MSRVWTTSKLKGNLVLAKHFCLCCRTQDVLIWCCLRKIKQADDNDLMGLRWMVWVCIYTVTLSLKLSKILWQQWDECLQYPRTSVIISQLIDPLISGWAQLLTVCRLIDMVQSKFTDPIIKIWCDHHRLCMSISVQKVFYWKPDGQPSLVSGALASVQLYNGFH